MIKTDNPPRLHFHCQQTQEPKKEQEEGEEGSSSCSSYEQEHPAWCRGGDGMRQAFLFWIGLDWSFFSKKLWDVTVNRWRAYCSYTVTVTVSSFRGQPGESVRSENPIHACCVGCGYGMDTAWAFPPRELQVVSGKWEVLSGNRCALWQNRERTGQETGIDINTICEKTSCSMQHSHFFHYFTAMSFLLLRMTYGIANCYRRGTNNNS